MIDKAGPDLSEFADRYYSDTASYTQNASNQALTYGNTVNHINQVLGGQRPDATGHIRAALSSVEQVLDIDSLLRDPAADLLHNPVAASATPEQPGKPVCIQVVFHADPLVGTGVLFVSARISVGGCQADATILPARDTTTVKRVYR